MITWDAACKEVGYDPLALDRIDKTYTYYAYRSGICEIYTTEKEAKTRSTMVEKKCNNQEAWDAYWNGRKVLESSARELWYASMKDEYLAPNGSLSPLMFDLCYDEAYDRGHSAGYDEVANYMSSVSDFALKIKDAVCLNQ